jgi:hypothetical protein
MNPAPFDRSSHPKLMIEHYCDPLTFQPPKPGRSAENWDDLYCPGEDHEFMSDYQPNFFIEAKRSFPYT